MLEIEKLEKEWRKYRAKRMKPWFVLFFAAVFLTGGYLILQNYGSDIVTFNLTNGSTEKKSEPAAVPVAEKTPETQKRADEALAGNIPVAKTEVAKVPVAAKPEVPAAIDEKETSLPKTEEPAVAVKETPKKETSVVLNPDIDFLENISPSHERSHKVYSKPVKAVKHETIAADIPPKQSTRQSKNRAEDDSGMKQETESGKNSTLMIRSTKANNTLEYLIKRFNERRDPKLASYIAQSYYKKGKYKEAVKWSVMANSLDPSSEETWLIFARSKVKLGQKEDAIRALRVYLNQYSSRNIKSFLQSLEAGR
ncbi:CDC27 family protein [Hydrogenimonas sp.]